MSSLPPALRNSYYSNDNEWVVFYLLIKKKIKIIIEYSTTFRLATALCKSLHQTEAGQGRLGVERILLAQEKEPARMSTNESNVFFRPSFSREIEE